MVYHLEPVPRKRPRTTKDQQTPSLTPVGGGPQPPMEILLGTRIFQDGRKQRPTHRQSRRMQERIQCNRHGM